MKKRKHIMIAALLIASLLTGTVAGRFTLIEAKAVGGSEQTVVSENDTGESGGSAVQPDVGKDRIDALPTGNEGGQDEQTLQTVEETKVSGEELTIGSDIGMQAQPSGEETTIPLGASGEETVMPAATLEEGVMIPDEDSDVAAPEGVSFLSQPEYMDAAGSAGDEDEQIINVALPGNLSLRIDPFSLDTKDRDTQITSEVYEIVNYGDTDVVVDVRPSITSSGFALVGDKPETGTYVSAEAEEGKPVYLAVQIADCGDEQDILDGNYTFEQTQYDLVVSKEDPDHCRFLLAAAKGGQPTSESKAAFRFRGNANPRVKYLDGELKFKVEFQMHLLSDTEMDSLREAAVEEKLNFLENN